MTQENTALLEALANIQEELALTLEELIDHNGDSMDDARRKRIDQLRARHWSDCAVYNEPHAPSGPCDCGGYLVSITTPTTDSLTADAAAVREAAAKAIGEVLGIDIYEQCADPDGELNGCDSSTCPGALTEDHDTEEHRDRIYRMADAAIRALQHPGNDICPCCHTVFPVRKEDQPNDQ